MSRFLPYSPEQAYWLPPSVRVRLLDGQPAALAGINMDASVHGDSNPAPIPEPAA